MGILSRVVPEPSVSGIGVCQGRAFGVRVGVFAKKKIVEGRGSYSNSLWTTPKLKFRGVYSKSTNIFFIVVSPLSPYTLSTHSLLFFIFFLALLLF
ncbi:unnamed protein product [Meloidogyne enterolobii]|uniref:Uncharacterized protein n=1 Tax=Meloidogyne enterolobii TaxID=390850 RepID=A0ACB1ARG0_MELEN